MLLYTKKEDCCGCGACANSCARGAIQMVRDKEGFDYPVIDSSVCINCGVCEKVCPMKVSMGEVQENLYAGAQVKDPAARSSSSSGGVFPVLAQFVLQKQGVVYGAAYDENMRVIHSKARTMEELERLKKTKYVQSSLGGVYGEIQTFLDDKRWVLFCGTPCQVRALRLFLKKEYDTLILVDLVCYGVPSPGLWEKYVHMLERRHKGKLTDFSFRDKRKKDHGHTCAYTVGETEYAKPLTQDPYCRLYFQNYTLRPSCHACRFCTVKRDSDFTIGDFWGIERVRADMDDGMGTSLVILHTKKAREIWEKVQEAFSWFSCKEKDVLQPRLLGATVPAKTRKLFMALNRILPVSWVIRLAPAWAFLKRGVEIGTELEWRLYRKWKRCRLKRTDFSIIASNCNGTFMYYDMGLPYLSPTINLTIDMKSLIKMAGNLHWYMEQELTEVKEEDMPCPAGMLGDIRVNFVHYKTFAEGARKWEERKRRINWENLFLVGAEKGNCSYETIRQFDQLPYENKVIFTHVEYPEFPSAYCIKGFEEYSELGTTTNFKKQFWKRRYLDDFDYVAFLNRSAKGRRKTGSRRR